MSKLSLSHIIKIPFHDVDSLGIVWHGHYIKYFEVAREAFCMQHHISYLDAKQHGYATPIIKTETDHKLPLTYGDTAKIDVIFVPSEAAKMIFEYQIYNAQNDLVCTGKTIQVFVTAKDYQLALVAPDFYKSWLSDQFK